MLTLIFEEAAVPNSTNTRMSLDLECCVFVHFFCHIAAMVRRD